jgi:hypothetical protein
LASNYGIQLSSCQAYCSTNQPLQSFLHHWQARKVAEAAHIACGRRSGSEKRVQQRDKIGRAALKLPLLPARPAVAAATESMCCLRPTKIVSYAPTRLASFIRIAAA